MGTRTRSRMFAARPHSKSIGMNSPTYSQVDQMRIRSSRRCNIYARIAITELKKKDVFKIHGLCEMRVRHLKGRVATKSTCFGKDIEMKAKPPMKRVYAKVVKDLSDCVVKEGNT